MSEPRFTKGPWHACHNGKCSCKQIWSMGYPVAKVEAGEWGDSYPALGEIAQETAEANCLLIAAAPDLYAALEGVLPQLAVLRGFAKDEISRNRVNEKIEQAEAALKKARGE